MNLLGIGPYKQHFYDTAISSLEHVLRSSDSVDSIEVELKYAEFMYFNPIYPNILQQFPQVDREKVAWGHNLATSNY